MKTVSGKVISTTTISLPKAAKVLSNFVAADAGAPQAVSAYLRRATAAFDELVRLHRDLKASGKPVEEDGDRAAGDGEGKKHRKKRKEEQRAEESSRKKKRRTESEQ